MTSAAALDAIEQMSDPGAPEHVRTLVGLLVHQNARVRHRSAELLGYHVRGRAPLALIRALEHDPDDLVRVEAADSLGAIGDARAAAALRRALGDPSPLVRAYAAAALGDLGRPSDAAILRRRLAIEKRRRVHVGLLGALYVLGDDDAFPRLLELSAHSNYRVRCAVANRVAFLQESKQVTREHQVLARRVLLEAAAREQTVAASSSIAKALKCLGVRQSRTTRAR